MDLRRLFGSRSGGVRRAAAIVATALLLFLQLQAAVHPITHVKPAGPSTATLSSPVAVDDCVECALLAGGVHGLAGAAASAFAPPAPLAGAIVAPALVGADEPLPYRSRAPPAHA